MGELPEGRLTDSRTDLAESESDAKSRRRLDYAGVHGNRLPPWNANVAYNDYDAVWVHTQPQ